MRDFVDFDKPLPDLVGVMFGERYRDIGRRRGRRKQ